LTTWSPVAGRLERVSNLVAACIPATPRKRSIEQFLANDQKRLAVSKAQAKAPQKDAVNATRWALYAHTAGQN
jgi:hypothetical protein